MEPKGSIFLWGKTSVERREKSSFEIRDRVGKEKEEKVDGFDQLAKIVSRILPPNKNGAPRDAVFFDSNEPYFFIASFALSRTFAKIPFSTLGLADTMLPVCM